MQMLKRAVPLIAFLLIAVVLGACGQSEQNNEASSSAEFQRLNNDIRQMEAADILFVQKQQVQFDRDAAQAANYSQSSIELAQELAAYSNELVDKSREAGESDAVGIDPLGVETTDYPAVEAYFGAATTNLDNVSEKSSEDLDVQQNNGDICGDYDNPLPRSGGPRRIITTSNPEAALEARGYHSTPRLAFGGGWTLPKTYQERYCGRGTYRWHGIVRSDGFSEQYYNGSPPGEPNPEFYRSAVWPFATWPAYVRWWHQNF